MYTNLANTTNLSEVELFNANYSTPVFTMVKPKSLSMMTICIIAVFHGIHISLLCNNTFCNYCTGVGAEDKHQVDRKPWRWCCTTLAAQLLPAIRR